MAPVTRVITALQCTFQSENSLIFDLELNSRKIVEIPLSVHMPVALTCTIITQSFCIDRLDQTEKTKVD